MVLGTIVLIANSLVGTINPMGYAFTQYPPISESTQAIMISETMDKDTVSTNIRGRYYGYLSLTDPPSLVSFEFTRDSTKKAFLKDIVGETNVGNITPEVFLYDPDSNNRHVTASVYNLIDTSGVDTTLIKTILTNQTKSQSDSGIVYPDTAYSDVLAHIRADAGDSLLLKIFAPRDSASQFVSYRTFVAPDSGNDAVFVRNDTTSNPSRRNYGVVYFPDSIEILPFIDVGVSRIIAPTGQVDSGFSITPRAIVENLGNAPIDSLPVLMRIGQNYSQYSFVRSLGVGQSNTISFADWHALVRGNNAVKCSTMVAGDINPSNDALNDNVFVRVFNARPYSIDSPAGLLGLSQPVTPRATFENLGNITIDSIVGQFFISRNGSQIYGARAKIDSVAPNARPQVSFAQWQPESTGTHSCSLHMTAYEGSSLDEGSMSTKQPGLDLNDYLGTPKDILERFGKLKDPNGLLKREELPDLMPGKSGVFPDKK